MPSEHTDHIEGFQPEWYISTIYHAWITPFWSETLNMIQDRHFSAHNQCTWSCWHSIHWNPDFLRDDPYIYSQSSCFLLQQLGDRTSTTCSVTITLKTQNRLDYTHPSPHLSIFLYLFSLSFWYQLVYNKVDIFFLCTISTFKQSKSANGTALLKIKDYICGSQKYKEV